MMPPMTAGGEGSGHAGCCASRRTVLSALAALGACSLMSGTEAIAAADAKPKRINVHHHVLPPTLAALTKSKNMQAPVWTDWTPDKGIEDMDRGGVSLAMLSITTPGLWFGDAAEAARVARECNDYAATLVSDRKGRFGMFAALPLPDVGGALREIEYALDVLKADGVAMFTSYDGKWLGDPAFDPVFAELDRRKAVVYTHPNTPNCCRNLVPGLRPSSIEFGTDTTRAIARMLFSGAAQRYRNMTMIFSHAGGTMPFLIERFVIEAKAREKDRAPGYQAIEDLQRFYYDTAQAANPASMSALKKVVPMSQIVFGSDFPFRNSLEHVQALKQGGIFNAKELRAIDRDNALRLLPRWNLA